MSIQYTNIQKQYTCCCFSLFKEKHPDKFKHYVELLLSSKEAQFLEELTSKKMKQSRTLVVLTRTPSPHVLCLPLVCGSFS